MTVKLIELEITNFRGIEHLALSFRDPNGAPSPLVVLAGPNGCGKTAALEAILVATGYHELARGKTGPAAVRSGTEDYLIRATLMNDKQEANNVSCRKTTERSQTGHVAYFSSWREPKLVGFLGITAGKKGKRPAATETNRLWRLKQYLIDAFALELFAMSRESSGPTRKSSAFEQALTKLDRVWQRFYPDELFNVEPVDQSPDGGFDLFVRHTKGVRISVDDLSSGQLELLQFCADFLVSPIQPDLLVIDEPELHLDPAWHTQIIRAIQDLAPDTQLIVATHSPEIYDAAMSHERHFLVPESDPRSQFWARSCELLEAATNEHCETAL